MHDAVRADTTRARVRRGVPTFLLALVVTAPLHAAAPVDGYPSRPVRFVVPFTPGTLDVMVRQIGQKLAEKYGQPVIVDSRPGAGTIVGTEIVSKASPDGHTFLVNTTTFVINPSLHAKLPYDPVRDFTPVTQIDAVANILVTSPTSPAQTIKDVIALAKAKPGLLTYASPGSGSAPHIATEMFKSMAGIDMVHVPYRGIPEAAGDVMAGRVSMLMTTTASASPYLRGGRLRGLAVSSRQRVASLPDIQTMGETLPGYEMDAFRGVIGPAGIPPAIVKRVSGDIANIVRNTEIRDILMADGSAPVGSTPEQFTAFLKSEMAKWGKVVKASGAKAD
ncbi:MAG: tripartite tricarboxylate transporter substrate binding protein [Proteobacteria bacterium]|nr:tripartite tricarboxylate transporter substrate binding protein [Burkholderiales bacterium]